jgi:hypothetical protein
MPLKKYDIMPHGWKIDPTFGSPEHGYLPICNGKSLINGGEKGLLKLVKIDQICAITENVKYEKPSNIKSELPQSKEEIKNAYKVINDLAREKFKEKMMQEILFDMSVCRLEGWDIFQYAIQLKNLINEVTKNMNKQECKQPKEEVKE